VQEIQQAVVIRAVDLYLRGRIAYQTNVAAGDAPPAGREMRAGRDAGELNFDRFEADAAEKSFELAARAL
jgi:hypothetical protein